MTRNENRMGRREFVYGLGIAAFVGAPRRVVGQQAGNSPPLWGGTILHAADGLQIPPTPDGRRVTIKIDSEVNAQVRMSMITEDLPPKSEIRVHLHQREDEMIFIRMGTGVATLADREIPVAAGATVYVPRGVWHGLRNTGAEMLGMTAVYAPPGFEQSFKDRLLHPNRTQAEIEANRKKHGIVYREK